MIALAVMVFFVMNQNSFESGFYFPKPVIVQVPASAYPHSDLRFNGFARQTAEQA